MAGYNEVLNDEEAFQSSGLMGPAQQITIFLLSSITKSCDWEMTNFVMPKRISRLFF